MFLEARDLTVFYGDVQALFGVSFHINEGEIIAIVGSNAAGKSTTLKTISGLLRPKSGMITFDGQNLEKLSSDKIVDAGIVLVPEGRQLFPAMTVLENLEMGSFLPEAKKKRSQTLRWVFNFFPILKDRLHPIVRQTVCCGEGSKGPQPRTIRRIVSLPSLGRFTRVGQGRTVL